jgi:hypothetical protein
MDTTTFIELLTLEKFNILKHLDLDILYIKNLKLNIDEKLDFKDSKIKTIRIYKISALTKIHNVTKLDNNLIAIKVQEHVFYEVDNMLPKFLKNIDLNDKEKFEFMPSQCYEIMHILYKKGIDKILSKDLNREEMTKFAKDNVDNYFNNIYTKTKK